MPKGYGEGIVQTPNAAPAAAAKAVVARKSVGRKAIPVRFRSRAPYRTSFFENGFESGWEKDLRLVLNFGDLSTPNLDAKCDFYFFQ